VHTTPFSLVIGDTNLVGGINLIYTELSWTSNGVDYYSDTWVDKRD
jgi:hypothetical protein